MRKCFARSEHMVGLRSGEGLQYDAEALICTGFTKCGIEGVLAEIQKFLKNGGFQASL